eukprot:SAG31_NODE_19398_length_603_cov_1.281746_1_plen_54_part_00
MSQPMGIQIGRVDLDLRTEVCQEGFRVSDHEKIPSPPEIGQAMGEGTYVKGDL